MRSRNPIRATIEFLEHHPHELVVLATEGSRGREDWLYQSEAEAIVRGSDAMTMFVPSRSHRGLIFEVYFTDFVNAVAASNPDSTLLHFDGHGNPVVLNSAQTSAGAYFDQSVIKLSQQLDIFFAHSPG